MIYTVTCNPSIDYIVTVPEFHLGSVNRSTEEYVFSGGKGINVAVMLSHLGIPCKAFGFLAGFTGKEIERRLLETGCQAHFIWLKEGISRINLKLRAEEETEINGQGPDIPEYALTALYEKLDSLSEMDYLVLAGSIPDTLPADIYEKIMARLQKRKIKIVVDATKELLRNVLKYHPFLVKPNHHELAELFGKEALSEEELFYYGKEVQKLGAKNVLISRAKDGAILIGEDGREYLCKAPEGTVKNSVGAGDSMVAGFLAGYTETGNLQEAFYRGIAAGSASAFQDSLATKEEVYSVLSQMQKNETV